MVRLVLAAIALGSGVPAAAVGAGWLMTTQPMLGLAAASAWVLVSRHRRAGSAPGPDDEAAFLHGLASELAGGAAPRAALTAAAGRAPRLALGRAVRLADAGMPAERVAPVLEAALPANGRLVAGAWLLCSRSGGPATSIFNALALRSAEEGALRRERRALTAQARASAWVVAGLPMLLLAAMALTGRLDVADPTLAGVIVTGVTLQAAGVAVVVMMLRGAR